MALRCEDRIFEANDELEGVWECSGLTVLRIAQVRNEFGGSAVRKTTSSDKDEVREVAS